MRIVAQSHVPTTSTFVHLGYLATFGIKPADSIFAPGLILAILGATLTLAFRPNIPARMGCAAGLAIGFAIIGLGFFSRGLAGALAIWLGEWIAGLAALLALAFFFRKIPANQPAQRHKLALYGGASLVLGFAAMFFAHRFGYVQFDHPEAATREHIEGLLYQIESRLQDGLPIPTSVFELIPEDRWERSAVDGWMRPMQLRIQHVNGQTICKIVSAGPDGIFDTPDDIDEGYSRRPPENSAPD
ncbi:MAG TPA: hypothetical protein VGP72_17900 [Planctomycetota bacterium]|jgi:hypothetical protein